MFLGAIDWIQTGYCSLSVQSSDGSLQTNDMGGVIINISSKEKKSSAQDWRTYSPVLRLRLKSKFGTGVLPIEPSLMTETFAPNGKGRKLTMFKSSKVTLSLLTIVVLSGCAASAPT